MLFAVRLHQAELLPPLCRGAKLLRQDVMAAILEVGEISRDLQPEVLQAARGWREGTQRFEELGLELALLLGSLLSSLQNALYAS